MDDQNNNARDPDVSLSIILPALNEADNLSRLLPELKKAQPRAEIIVVNDGSSDDTLSVCRNFGVTTVSHPYSMGNGAAIKSGARAATGDVLVFMDADGQHQPGDIARLLEKMNDGFEMVVGARNPGSQSSWIRNIGNKFYNYLASFMTGYSIHDLTSGFRAVTRINFIRFLYLLPNRFSYPTTITMAFFRSGLPVAYVPVDVRTRIGKSHINLFRDGVRFFVIILKVGALFSPMRLFLPISTFIFLTGMSYFIYTYINFGRFTNMSALLLLSALLVFLMGIMAEHIAFLNYKDVEQYRPDIRKSSRD